MLCLLTCMHTTCILGTLGIHQREVDLMEPDFWMITDYHVDAGTKPGFSARATVGLNK